MMRFTTQGLLATCCIVALATPAAAQTQSYRIPAGTLKSALDGYVRISGKQVMYKVDEIRGVHSPGVSGTMTPDAALRAILSDTGFTIYADPSGALAIVRAPGVGASTAEASPDSNDIIVTASKRGESLRTIASSVTAVSEEQLTANGAQNFKDYIAGLPGVQFQQSTPGISNVTIRGIGTATIYPDQGQSTTGIYINDVPLSDPGFALSVPDLDVFDMQRIEVLRGPQGTLFGAATLGGAVNYISNPVSLSDVQARGQTSLYGIEGGSKLGYSVKAALNIPIVQDTLGVRMTAIRHADPGYLDNVGSGDRDTNTRKVDGLRLNVLWKISDAFRLSYFGFYDHARLGDGFGAFAGIGDLKRDTIINEKTTFTTKVNNVKLDGNLGFATLGLSAADTRKAQYSIADYTPYYGGPPTVVPNYPRSHSQIAEARLVSPGRQKVDWLVGVYYGRTSEHYPNSTIQDGVVIYDYSVDYRQTEKSVFGEATYHLTDTLRITGGGRYYDLEITTLTQQGAPGAPKDSVGGRQQAHGFSPKASIAYAPSKSLMVYALLSKGFRAGGVNLTPALNGFSTPANYGSDSVLNYELGIRGALLDGRLVIDSTAYYVDWSDIQIGLLRPDGYAYVANAGSARSTGIENAVSWQPSKRFSLSANLTYLSAQLTKTLALGNGTVLEKGRDLPGAYHWSGSQTATYRFDLASQPYVTLQHQHVSRATDDFDSEQVVGGYSSFSVRSGVQLGKFAVQAFVTNLTDKRGRTASASFGENQLVYYIQPRTIGLSIDWKM